MGKPMSKLRTMLQVSRTFGMRDGMLRLEYELQPWQRLMSWRMRSVHGWDSWDLKRIAANTSSEEMRIRAVMARGRSSSPTHKPSGQA